MKNSNHKTDIVTFKVIPFVKMSNKTLKTKFDLLEEQKFVGHKKAYLYIVENFGSGFFACVEVYLNNERKTYFHLK